MIDHLTGPRLDAAIGIPVRDEIERIGPCLKALAGQVGIGRERYGVVLFLNNCRDGTAALVRSLAPELGLRLKVVERDHGAATAGWARREALEAAARWLEREGSASAALLTTDADSRVGADWIAQSFLALARGADAVAGTVALDASEEAALPASLRERGRLEAAHEAALIELEALLDPLPYDPWPRHWTASGASLAVRLDAYRRVGGMPAVGLGEDKAFVAALLAHDARVRHDPGIVVTTSGRQVGRATGGTADTIRLRCEQPDSPCDPRLETTASAAYRFRTHRRLRRLFEAGRLGDLSLWADALRLRPAEATAIALLPRAGEVIAAADAASPRLASRPLRPSQLAAETRLARAAIDRLRPEIGAVLNAPPRAGRAPLRTSERPRLALCTAPTAS